MAEINLMDRYPRSKRSLGSRQDVTPEDIAIACQFGRDYFDGDRKRGYGGYNYHPRFWQETVQRFRDHYQLPPDARVLDVGCGKGFMLYDFKQLMPDLQITGVDVSQYALDHSKEEVRPFLQKANAKELPFDDKSFDLVTAINTIHNLDVDDCKRSLREIERVSRGKSFLVVDAWRSDEQRRNLEEWILTAKSYFHVDDWTKIFREVGYTGDYYWFFFE